MVDAKDLKQELRDEARSLEGEMIGEVNKAKSLDVESLEKQAAKTIRDAAGKVNSIGQPDGAGKTP